MWGNVVLESNFYKNYNFSFLQNNSDVVISLIHWQYWWWFWFSFLLCFYYILLIRSISTHNIKFYPKIVNSFRSHGKFGDVIVCILPITWCINILSNSSALLKLIEWQCESSLITLRVRGKQWYWVYKLDLNIVSCNINVDLLNTHIGYSNINSNNNYSNYPILSILNSFFFNNDRKFFSNTLQFNKLFNISKLNINHNDVNNLIFFNLTFFTFIDSTKINIINFDIYNNYKSLLNINDSQLISILLRDSVNNNFIGINKLYKLYYNNNNTLKVNDIKFYTFVQKKLENWDKISKIKLKRNNLFDNFLNFNDLDNLYSYSNNRLLNVNGILILPSNIFINVITNSFDVIHSWFIPGLGFKMDCVPGRSTHHTLYIDLPGIYYGQCAEICGRFHHHMPIKICSLYLDHYLMYIYNFNKKFIKMYI